MVISVPVLMDLLGPTVRATLMTVPRHLVIMVASAETASTPTHATVQLASVAGDVRPTGMSVLTICVAMVSVSMVSMTSLATAILDMLADFVTRRLMNVR